MRRHIGDNAMRFHEKLNATTAVNGVGTKSYRLRDVSSPSSMSTRTIRIPNDGGWRRRRHLRLRHYDRAGVTIRDAILTCAQKLTRISLIYRTEPTTKKWKTEKVKSKKKRICSQVSVNSPFNTD